MFVEERVADLKELIGSQSGDVARIAAADNHCIVTRVCIIRQRQRGCGRWEGHRRHG